MPVEPSQPPPVRRSLTGQGWHRLFVGSCSVAAAVNLLLLVTPSSALDVWGASAALAASVIALAAILMHRRTNDPT